MVDLERFRIEGTRLWVRCPKCAAEHGVESAAAPLSSVAGAGSMTGSPKVSLVSSPHASNVLTLRTAATEAVQLAAGSLENPLAVPAGRCPKCLAKRGESQASCPQCGLVFERFNPATVEVPQWLLDGWTDLLRDWGNQARHERLRSDASQRGSLSHLGRLYRLRLTWFPDDPWAELGRTEIVRMAEAAVSAGLADAQPANFEDPRPKARGLVVGGLVIFLVAALAYLGRLLLKG